MKTAQKQSHHPVDQDEAATDLEILKRIRNDDPEAFSSLFRSFYEPLYRFAMRFVREPQTAENLVQDVFVKLWEARKSMHIRSNVRAYLYTAVRNHVLNYLRREKKRRPVEIHAGLTEEISPSPEDAFIQSETAELVRQAIEKLPDRCRLIYRMNRYDGLAYAEIAAILNISANTVKTQMRRALKALQKHLVQVLSTLCNILFI